MEPRDLRDRLCSVLHTLTNPGPVPEFSDARAHYTSCIQICLFCSVIWRCCNLGIRGLLNFLMLLTPTCAKICNSLSILSHLIGRTCPEWITKRPTEQEANKYALVIFHLLHNFCTLKYTPQRVTYNVQMTLYRPNIDIVIDWPVKAQTSWYFLSRHAALIFLSWPVISYRFSCICLTSTCFNQPTNQQFLYHFK